jgi:hypothetical protein
MLTEKIVEPIHPPWENAICARATGQWPRPNA